MVLLGAIFFLDLWYFWGQWQRIELNWKLSKKTVPIIPIQKKIKLFFAKKNKKVNESVPLSSMKWTYFRPSPQTISINNLKSFCSLKTNRRHNKNKWSEKKSNFPSSQSHDRKQFLCYFAWVNYIQTIQLPKNPSSWELQIVNQPSAYNLTSGLTAD